MKSAFRWILVLPFSCIAALAAYLLAKLWLFIAPIIPFDWLRSLTLWWVEIIASYMLGTVFLVAAYAMLPKHKLAGTYVVMGIGALFVVACVWSDWTVNHQFQARSVAGVALGLIQGLCEAHKEHDKAERAARLAPAT